MTARVRTAGRARCAAALAVALTVPAAGAGADEVVVEVRAVASASGVVRVALCTAETFLERDCPWTASAAAEPGSTTVTVRGVPPGEYAVQAFHDANANREIDRDFLGLPREGIGFGNDARMRFGPPAFAEASVRVEAPVTATTLGLRYLTGR